MSSQIMFEHQYNKAKALTEQKKRKTRQDSRNLSEIGEIREEIKRLKEEHHLTAYQYSASKLSTYDSESSLVFNKEGMPAAYCKQMVEDMHELVPSFSLPRFLPLALPTRKKNMGGVETGFSELALAS